MKDRERERELSDLFLEAGRLTGKSARWVNHYQSWCRRLVADGCYDRVRAVLVRVVGEPG